MALPIILILTFWAATAQPEHWQCRNDVEIQCTSESCEAATEDSFTPMSVTVDDAGFMSVCAYSGCWEGTGTVVKNKDFLILVGDELTFSTSPDSKETQESIVIALDRSDRVAILKAGAFAHPLLCERETQE